MKTNSKSFVAVIVSVILVLSMSALAIFSAVATDMIGVADAEGTTVAETEVTVPDVDEPTDEPTTAAPVVDENTTAAPVVDEPTTAAPVVDEPTTASPVVDEPTTAAPVVDDTTEAPVVDETTTAAPVVDESTTATPEKDPVGKVGDVNNDGKVNSADARLILRVCARLDASDALKNVLCDVDGSKAVQSADARLVLRYAAKLDDASKSLIEKLVYESDEGITVIFDVTTVAA